MLKFLLSVCAVVIAVSVAPAFAATNSCEDEDNDAIAPEFALCSTHVYNIGMTENPDSAGRALMQEVIGKKTTVITQQMYKQYQQMESMLRRFKTQLEKAVLKNKFEMAGAKDEDDDDSSGGGYTSKDTGIYIGGAQDCSRLYSTKEILDCYRANLETIERTSNYGNSLSNDVKKQFAKDFKGLNSQRFAGGDPVTVTNATAGSCNKKSDDSCFQTGNKMNKTLFKNCKQAMQDCLRNHFTKYEEQQNSYRRYQ